mgnify:CR=1 FL=1|tara:strand:- start:240 stop:1406 length:1167 start_codon:yes stop_codon:yes gene_type:complete
MAESGIASLSDEQSRELARVAAEQLGDREFELEMYRDLPPSMQPGGIYSLLSDVGRSRKGLSYHTYGHMPKELEEDYNKLVELYNATAEKQGPGSPEAKAVGKFLYNQRPRLYSSSLYDEPDNEIAGLFREQAASPEELKKFSLTPNTMFYGTSEEPMVQFPMGAKGAPLPPSFLSNPNEAEGPSISLGQYGNEPRGLTSSGSLEPSKRSTEDSTFWHELLHAGSRDPRFETLTPEGKLNKDHFVFDRSFLDLSKKDQNDIFEVFRNDHTFTGPVQRYRTKYEYVKKQFTPEMFQMMEQHKEEFKEEFSEEEIAKYEEVKRMRDAGLDYLHPLAKKRLDKDDLEKVNIYEKASNFLRTFLNETSDLTTGEKKGYLYYPEASKPKVTSP